MLPQTLWRTVVQQLHLVQQSWAAAGPADDAALALFNQQMYQLAGMGSLSGLVTRKACATLCAEPPGTHHAAGLQRVLGRLA